MSNRKQSSIEWLIQKQKDIEKGVFDGFSHLSISSMYEQVKEIHRQEIMYAYEVGFSDGWNDVKYDKPKYSDSENYYTETYKD